MYDRIWVGGGMEVQHHLFLTLASDKNEMWAVSLSCRTLRDVSAVDQRFSLDTLD